MYRIGLWFLFEPLEMSPDEVEDCIKGLIICLQDDEKLRLCDDVHIQKLKVEEDI